MVDRDEAATLLLRQLDGVLMEMRTNGEELLSSGFMELCKHGWREGESSGDGKFMERLRVMIERRLVEQWWL